MLQQHAFAEKRPRVTSMSLLRVSVGVVYCWFGALKFVSGLSPAEQLAMQTIHELTFGLIDDHVNLFLLASWECTIGILLIIGRFVKPVLALLLLHMLCTFTPFIFFPQETFRHMPYGLTLTGQYIMKNIVFISAGIVLWKNESEKQQAHLSRIVAIL